MVRQLTISRRTKIFIIIAIFLLLFLAGFIFYKYFIIENTESYLIKNKYYSFELSAPKSWTAEGKTQLYSEDNINQILADCKEDKLGGQAVYEIGRFRFESQNYPKGFGEIGYFPAGFKSGAILDISINCIPDGTQSKIINYNYSSPKTGGEKTFEEFINLPEFGKTKYLSFFHKNFQYKINEYIYISPGDSKNEKSLREKYSNMFSKTIPSFKFND